MVNIFTESRDTGATLLRESADVDMVSFTGSIPVDRQIAAAGAPTLKGRTSSLAAKLR